MSRIIILSFIVCSSIIAQDGCMDMNACNYDPAATTGCEGEGGDADYCCEYVDYEIGECDCDGNIFDCSGECGGSDFSSCTMMYTSSFGIYENEDCTGELVIEVEGTCVVAPSDPDWWIFTESSCLEVEGLWLPGNTCYEEMVLIGESYEDLNGNGEYDEGEEFEDNNEDGEYTAVTEESCDEVGGIYGEETGVEDIIGNCAVYTATDTLTEEECGDLIWIESQSIADLFEAEFPLIYFYSDGTFNTSCDYECQFESDLTQEECEAAGGEYHSNSECDFDAQPSQEDCEAAGGYWDDYDMECEIYSESACDSLGGNYIEHIECELTEGECPMVGGSWDGGVCDTGTYTYVDGVFEMVFINPGDGPDGPTTITLIVDSDGSWMELQFTGQMDSGDGPCMLIVFTNGSMELGNNSIVLPDNITISAVYPNPFNPATTIDFSVAALSDISITVYDISGSVVDNIVNEENYNPGSYSMIWDASGFSSGVYFIRVESPSSSAAQKIMLIK